MLKQWGAVTILQLRRSADRCTGITRCDVDVDRSRDILANEAELWLIYLAPGHTPCYLLLLTTFFPSSFLYVTLLTCFLVCSSPAIPYFPFLKLTSFLSFSPAFILASELSLLPSCSPTPLSLFFSCLSFSWILPQCSQVACNQISGFSITFLLIPA